VKITAEPRSDQWNADDFIGGPRTFTIAGVKVGTAEQKYDIELVEGDGRFWRPPLTMLRLLIAAWGDEASVWVGRRVTLFRDESVRFGADAVGGIRISHLSHLPGNKPLVAMLTSTRGRRARHVAEPLPDEEPSPDGKPLSQRITEMVTAFSGMGITEAQITTKLGKGRGQWGAGDVEQMVVVYSAIKRGNADAAEMFPTVADPPEPQPDPPPPADGMASAEQLEKLRNIRKTERLDDDGSWFDYIKSATGARVTADEQLTQEQAGELIGIFNEDAARAAEAGAK